MRYAEGTRSSIGVGSKFRPRRICLLLHKHDEYHFTHSQHNSSRGSKLQISPGQALWTFGVLRRRETGPL